MMKEETSVRKYKGMESLQEWLVTDGYRLAQNVFNKEHNQCDWYAYRRARHPAISCECNEGKELQIVVNPYACHFNDQLYESVEMEVTGEAGGQWYQLKAYGIRQDGFEEKIRQAELSLVQAWNNLYRGLPSA
jgi:hypothetical protein